MKIYTAESARCDWCQIQQIENGFISLGHEIVNNSKDADLIYQNNPLFNQITKDKQDGKINGKIIFNILDLAVNLGPSFDIEKIKNQIIYADSVTCISETVQRDCLNRIKISPSVIYNPIQPISKTNQKKYKYDFMLVGRVADPNKRVNLAINALQLLGVPKDVVITSGSEFVGYGDYAGVTTKELLNDLYNSVRFVLVPTKYAYLGLPMIEALAAGKIPIICNDLDIIDEFFPENIFPEFRLIDPDPISIAKFISKYSYEDNYKDLSQRLFRYYKENLEEKFSNIGVAGRILDVFNKLK